VANGAGIIINVFVDLNVGMNRTGIIPGQAAVQLYVTCNNMEGIIPVGLHAYDGHITDIDFETREKRCAESYAKVEWTKNEILKAGLPKPVIVAGGSPSFPVHAGWAKAECSPGTFIYWDAGYLQKYREQPFNPAALVISRVISLPDETTICTDLGHKSIAAENPLQNRVLILNAAGLEFAGQSEDHLVLKAPKDHAYKVGDIIYGIPYHICPTCALYESAAIIKDQKLVGEWKIIARNRKISI
jgi:D-serine deaminase-like pyridoxal phosphate-dependent protein